MKSQQSLNKQQGASLLEITIYLFIAGIVVFGALRFFGPLRSNAESNKYVQDMNQVFAAATKAKSGQTYSAQVPGLIINAQNLPSSMINGTDIINDFGTLAFAQTNINGITNGGLIITSPNVPQSLCGNSIPQLAESAEIITVGGTSVKAQNAPVDEAALIANCGATNSIAFTLR